MPKKMPSAGGRVIIIVEKRKLCEISYWSLRNAKFFAKIMQKCLLIFEEREIFRENARNFLLRTQGVKLWTGGPVRGNVAGLWVLRACEFLFFKYFFSFCLLPLLFPLFSFFPLFPFFSFCLGSPGSDSFFEFEVSKFQSSKFQDSTVKLCTFKTSSCKVRSFKVQICGV